VSLPPSISRIAEGRAAGGPPPVPVWQNEVGGLTFRIDEAGEGEREGETVFAKWVPPGSGIDLAAEAERLRWAGPFTPVPCVKEYGFDDDGTAWLVTYALLGESAVSKRWLAEPATAVSALGAGLRALHEQLPVADCPFDWSVEERLARAARHTGRPVVGLPPAPPPDRLVVCHGDPCAPNTLLYDDGSWSGHVDMGAMGVADRWADLAVASWNTRMNYGPGWEDTLLDAYGIARDPERIDFYRRLWEAT
jgi:kanamycin kinase